MLLLLPDPLQVNYCVVTFDLTIHCYILHAVLLQRWRFTGTMCSIGRQLGGELTRTAGTGGGGQGAAIVEPSTDTQLLPLGVEG